MRTTVTLDPDVERLLRRVVRERGEPFKQVLNAALREGLRRADERTMAAKPFRQRTFAMGVPKIELTKALALADDLGDAALIAKLRAHR
jgi:hypothetical protein